MRIHQLVGALVATLAVGVVAQSQAPRPTAPSGPPPVPGGVLPTARPPQPPSGPVTGTGIIRGQVVRADTGQPLTRARVSVSRETPGAITALEARVATTDANGHYELKELPAGQYRLVAFKEGFTDASYGRNGPFAPLARIDLLDGQTLERIDFALITGGAIAGQVLDDAGEPVVGAYVQAANPQNPRQASSVDETDDRGQFRLFGLQPGDYLVAATDQSLRQPDTFRRELGARGPALATYYPGTSAATEAKRIHVDSGGEVTGLSITIAPVRAQAVTGTGVLRGRVTRLDNGQPLRRVLVTVRPSEPFDLPPTLTDGSGRFELTGAPAAAYTLTASKGGFVTWQYGQRRPNQPGRLIELARAATLDGVDLALPRGGVVTGRVLNEDGQPVRNATVQALRQQFVRGQRQLSPNVTMPDVTDDRGAFRIYGLPSGTYYISATKADPVRVPSVSGAGDLLSQSYSSTTTFYPGTPSPEAAQQVTVGLAQEVAGLSLTLARSEPASISVAVRTSDGQPAPQATRLMLGRSIAVGYAGLPASAVGGSQTWKNLPPGEYVVAARILESGESAMARVALDGVDASITLTLQKPNTARGRVTFDESVAPTSRRPAAMLRPADVHLLPLLPDLERTPMAAAFLMVGPSPSLPIPQPDWTFEMTFPRGAWLIHPSLPDGWAVTSMRLGDADIANTPLVFTGKDIEGIEIRVTNRVADLSGVIRDARGELVTDATVVLFADDPARWGLETRFVAVVRPNQGGRFTRQGLPPARYVAVALDYLEPGEETNPETLRRLQRTGTTFTLSGGDSKTLELTLLNLP